MKITKLIHACLLVETERASAIFDPGNFSKQAVIEHLDSVKSLDYIVVTHSHQDHLDEEVISSIVERWPNIQLAANSEATQRLSKFGLAAADDKCQSFSAPHEALPSGQEPPKNTGWHFEGLTHPGDSLSFEECKDILALPYVAPWGSTTTAVKLAIKLKPKYIVPIHDWHLNDRARTWYRQLLESSLEKEGIKILDVESEAVEL